MSKLDSTNSKALAKRDAWFERLDSEIEKLGNYGPFQIVPEAEAPLWVRRIEDEIAISLFPAANLRKSKVMTTKRIGSVVGHMCSSAVWFVQAICSHDKQTFGPPGNELDAELKEMGKQHLRDLLTKWYPGMRRLAKLALCSSVDQSFNDMSDFLTGYAAGFARKLRQQIRLKWAQRASRFISA